MSAGMEVEFSELLRRFAASEERAAAASAPDAAGEVLALAGRVRRRRLARTGAVAAAGAAAVLVGAVAVYGATRPGPVPPADDPTFVQTSTPTPSPSASPTPSPSPSLSPEPTDEPAADRGVTVHPLLPLAQELPPGLLDATTSAWRMTWYQAVAESGVSPAVLYLTSPDGVLYEVPVPDDVKPAPGSDSGEEWGVVDWVAGSSRALMYSAGPGSTGVVLVDLETGAVSDVDLPDDARLLLAPGGILQVTGWASEPTTITLLDEQGRVTASVGPFQPVDPPATDEESSGWAVNPSHTRLLLDTADGMRLLDVQDGLSELAMTGVHQPEDVWSWCTAEAWLDDTRFTLACEEWYPIDGGGGDGLVDELWVADIGAGTSTAMVAGPSPAIGTALWLTVETWDVAGTMVVLRGSGVYGSCNNGLSRLSPGGAMEAVPGPRISNVFGTSGSLVIGIAVDDCENPRQVAVDPWTGVETELVPRVPEAQEVNVYPILPSGTRLRQLW